MCMYASAKIMLNCAPMDGWLGFSGILSKQIAAISCPRKFISKANGMHKRDHAFRMNVVETLRLEAV